jgi:UDP-glucose:(heptosyl)LPS alpha-1,3-glucosyltransferase
MRIGFQIENLDRTRGGAETYVDRFARQLLSAGHEVHVFAGGFRDPPAGIAAHEVRPYTAAAARAACDAAKLDAVLGTGKCAGVSVYQPHGGVFLANRRQNLALLRNPPLAWLTGLVNAVIPKHRAMAALERNLYAQQSPRPQFVAISKMVAGHMREFHAVPDDRVSLVYNGVDTDAFSPARCLDLRDKQRAAWGLGLKTACFLLVAHNFRLKGVRELIEATALVRRHDRDFAVIVVGKERPGPWERLAAQWGCSDGIRFVGAMADPLPAYAAADVYVQPTWYDPCSLVVLEAWACGLPVITTKFNGAGELMQPGREGYVLDTPANTEGLSILMIDLLDKGRRREMGRAGRELAERHTLDDNLRAMTAVLEKAAAENRGR